MVEHTRIRVHSAALRLPALDEEELETLRGRIVCDDGSIELETRIHITQRGSILDGRHRARILVEAGHGDELVRQIRAGGGDWVKRLPEDVDPVLHVAQTQLGRRNTEKWQVALLLLPSYRKAIAEGKKLQGKRRKQPGGKSPVDAFCDLAPVSKTTLHDVDRVVRHASTEEMEGLHAGRISFGELKRKLKSTSKRVQSRCGSQDRESDQLPTSEADPPNSGGEHRGGVRAKTQQSPSRTTARSGSLEQACRPAVALLNQLLTVKPDKLAEANAAVLLTALEDVARDRILHAARHRN